MLKAKKSLGQHFLFDPRITARIARVAGDASSLNIIEIGPGPGGLTRAILEASVKSLTALEKDARCIAALAELKATHANLKIIEADALEANLPALVPVPRAIIANLPYNVGTALLLKWLEEIYLFPLPTPLPTCRAEAPPGNNEHALHDRAKAEAGEGSDGKAVAGEGAYRFLTLMFQKEVAERISANPGGKAYGRLSVLAQWLCEVSHAFDLPPGAFSPPPKVHSSVIVLKPRPAPLFPARKEALERVLAAAFGQRRKMLRQSLKALEVSAEALLKAAGIDGARRAETLTVEEFCRLAEAIPSAPPAAGT